MATFETCRHVPTFSVWEFGGFWWLLVVTGGCRYQVSNPQISHIIFFALHVEASYSLLILSTNSSGVSISIFEKPNHFFLTSSTCHPKFVGKERCNALMTFHEHCFADCLLVLRKVYLYCYDCLCERQHFVDAHPDL